MKITKTVLPHDSLLNNSNKKYDYSDSFEGLLTNYENKITSTDICKAFFSSSPDWVGKLFNLRNKIVSLFGLKTSGKIEDRKRQIENFKCESGDKLGLFKVFAKSEKEVILGEDDTHLNFRISLFLEQNRDETKMKRLIISTTVEFNNWFGRLYFLLIRPFHKIIVPIMLKGTIKGLEAKTLN